MVEASQGRIGRPYLKTTDPGVATGTLSTWDLEAGGSGVGGQPEYPLRFRNYFHLRSQHSTALKERSLPFNFQATKRTETGPSPSMLGQAKGHWSPWMQVLLFQF